MLSTSIFCRKYVFGIGTTTLFPEGPTMDLNSPVEELRFNALADLEAAKRDDARDFDILGGREEDTGERERDTGERERESIFKVM